MDVVISNCVINLAPDKAPVLAEIARILRPGGEFYFSDIYADRRIPEHLTKDKVCSHTVAVLSACSGPESPRSG